MFLEHHFTEKRRKALTNKQKMTISVRFVSDFGFAQ